MLYLPRFIELVELVDNILISNLHYNEYVSWVIFFKLMLLWLLLLCLLNIGTLSQAAGGLAIRFLTSS